MRSTSSGSSSTSSAVSFGDFTVDADNSFFGAPTTPTYRQKRDKTQGERGGRDTRQDTNFLLDRTAVKSREQNSSYT